MPGGLSRGHFFERLIHLLNLFLFMLYAQKYSCELATFQLSTIREHQTLHL